MMRLHRHVPALAAQRFCPMNAPACEVAVATGLESHSVRARSVMLWRIATDQTSWTARAAELLHEGTLDSTSEAFDPYHAPFSQIMLDARADAWDAGWAPTWVREAVDRLEPEAGTASIPSGRAGPDLLMASELHYAQDGSAQPLLDALGRHGRHPTALVTGGGALAWLLGARDRATAALRHLIDVVASSGAERVVADGPQTLWWLSAGPGLTGLEWPSNVTRAEFADALPAGARPVVQLGGGMFVHHTRPAYWLSGVQPDGRCIAPGFESQPGASARGCGDAPIYATVDRLASAVDPRQLWSAWTRTLAFSCGSDDGLWATRPDLAAELALARLRHVRELGARTLVTDSPLAAWWLNRHATSDGPSVRLLASLY